jgi:hypothetical protein
MQSRQSFFGVQLGWALAATAVCTLVGGCSSTVDSTSTATSGSTGETSSSSSSSGGTGGKGGAGGSGGTAGAGGAGGGVAGSGGSGGAAGSGGSGGSGVRRPMVGEVIFTELMPNPDMIVDTAGEWVELKNLSKDTLDIGGCHLKDAGTNGDDHTINVATLTMLPDAVIVMAKTDDPAQNGGIQGVAYAFAGGFALTNTGDEVILECDGVVIDSVVYTDMWPFTKGAAMQLASGKLTAMANDVQTNWCTATATYAPSELGTPGTTGNQCP